MDVTIRAVIHMEILWVDIHVGDGILQQHRYISTRIYIYIRVHVYIHFLVAILTGQYTVQICLILLPRKVYKCTGMIKAFKMAKKLRLLHSCAWRALTPLPACRHIYKRWQGVEISSLG